MLLALGAFVFSAPHAAATTRTLTVTPSFVHGDEVVNVSWSGFTPTDAASGLDAVSIAQCVAHPHSFDDCFFSLRPYDGGGDPLGTAAQGVTQSDGTGSVQFEARSAAYLPQLDCTTTKSCSIIAFEDDGQVVPPGQLPATTLIAPLRFAPTAADCPRKPAPDVIAVGESSASAAMDSWQSRLCVRQNPVSVDYTSSTSRIGTNAFFGNEVDIGVTSTRADLTQFPAPRRAFAYAPIDVTGVAIAFNVYDVKTGLRITHMNLTPRLVAILIAGQQPPSGPGHDLFADPEFLKLNPGHTWPVETQPPLLRAEPNADTWILTNWLQNDAAARRFLNGADPTAAVDPFWKEPPVIYPTDTFEQRDPLLAGVYVPRVGTLTNARRLFNFEAPGDAVLASRYTDGLFGIIDAVAARGFDLPTASILPDNAPAGTPFVAPTATGLERGLAAMQVQHGTGGHTLLANSSATGGAYPLVKVDYALVPTDHLTMRKAHSITALLNFVVFAGQSHGILPDGYLPLTAPLKEQTIGVAQRLANS
jgi:hypothetical protein